MVKGKGQFYVQDAQVKLTFQLDLLCDETSSLASWLLMSVDYIIQSFVSARRYTFEELVENHTLIERVVMEGRFPHGRCSHPVSRFASKIDLEFTKIQDEKPRSEVVVLSPPPEPVVCEVINYIEKPDSPKKTIGDRVAERIGEEADRLVSVSKAKDEVLKRYAPEMERDPELAQDLKNLLDIERINSFD